MIERIKPGVLYIILVLVLHAVGAGVAHAQSSESPAFKDEVAKQEEIYRSRGVLTPEGYKVDRSLVSYTITLPAEFDAALANLGPEQRWLDVGAGSGRAVLDYYTSKYDIMHVEGRERRGRKAQAVALSIEDRRDHIWAQNAPGLGDQVQYLFTKRLREYSLAELGRFNLISDVLGAFSYAVELSAYMKKVLDFLDLNASFYTVLQDVHLEKGANRPYYEGSPFLTEILKPDGSELRICSWLKSIKCVEVLCEPKTNFAPPLEAYRVRKVCNDVAVPGLQPVSYEAGTPPQRRYRLLSKEQQASRPVSENAGTVAGEE